MRGTQAMYFSFGAALDFLAVALIELHGRRLGAERMGSLGLFPLPVVYDAFYGDSSSYSELSRTIKLSSDQHISGFLLF